MWKNRERTLGRAAAAMALTALALSLVTLVMLAPYTAPVADDFGYGAPVYYALQAGQGLPGVLAAIAENIKYTYLNWQGTFSSVLLFSVQPGAFSAPLYAITPLVMLAVVIAPVFLALGTLRRSNKAGLLVVGSVIAFLSVQYLPSPADGLYWWNGAAHYLAFWFLAVLVATQQIRLSRSEGRGAGFYALSAAACVGAFLVGGGNYSTALVSALAAGGLTLLALVEKRCRPVVAVNALITLLTLGGLAISVVAPGNAVRQAGLAQCPPLAAIGMSFGQAALDIARMTDLSMLGALLFCVPVFLITVRESGYRFRFPLLILVGSFCAFAALYTPPIFAMGQSDVPRMNNLFWLAYVFLLFGNAFYLAGWVEGRLRAVAPARLRRLGVAVCAVGLALFSGTTLLRLRDTNAYLAYSDLRSGVLETYRREREARVAVYEDKSVPAPRFQPITRYPECFPKVKVLTWMSDLLVDGVPVDLPGYHTCGGEVTFIPLDKAVALLCPGERLSLADFSNTFPMGGEDCVPLREFCDLLGFAVSHDINYDTVQITTR